MEYTLIEKCRPFGSTGSLLDAAGFPPPTGAHMYMPGDFFSGNYLHWLWNFKGYYIEKKSFPRYISGPSWRKKATHSRRCAHMLILNFLTIYDSLHACIALTILSSGIETSREQRISNRINPDANFFTLDTIDTLFDPRLIVFGKQDSH